MQDTTATQGRESEANADYVGQSRERVLFDADARQATLGPLLDRPGVRYAEYVLTRLSFHSPPLYLNDQLALMVYATNPRMLPKGNTSRVKLDWAQDASAFAVACVWAVEGLVQGSMDHGKLFKHVESRQAAREFLIDWLWLRDQERKGLDYAECTPRSQLCALAMVEFGISRPIAKSKRQAILRAIPLFQNWLAEEKGLKVHDSAFVVEDVAQELEILRWQHSLPGVYSRRADGTFVSSPWGIRDALKRSWRRWAPFAEMDSHASPARPTECDPAEMVASADAVAAILDAADADERYILTHLNQTDVELAEVLGISPQAVGKRRRKALERHSKPA